MSFNTVGVTDGAESDSEHNLQAIITRRIKIYGGKIGLSLRVEMLR